MHLVQVGVGTQYLRAEGARAYRTIVNSSTGSAKPFNMMTT